MISKLPIEEKKPLVDEVTVEEPVEEAIPVAEPKKEEEKSTDEQAGNIGLAPSI